ncbi:MAG: L-histidine N(alpha)-methyltransferase [Pseudomonadota bacterium]|nr:L-histidine N(alpha)-methyltransferase [Pseudomonadota bacterium]
MSVLAADAVGIDPAVARVVREGLTQRHKRLPPWLLYDAEGSRLFERITTLPSYYLTRAERAVLEQHGPEIVEAAGPCNSAGAIDEVVELGAGTATKSQLLLRVLVARDGATRFVPVDVSAAPVNAARARLARDLPTVTVAPRFQHHEAALAALAAIPARRLVLFLGSSIGNLEPAEAASLLRAVRACVTPTGALVLGTDLRKSPDVLVPAYDDPEGVSAAFNKNVLARINRELGGTFDLGAVRHVAEWNGAGSRMDMYLESTREQAVFIAALGLTVRLAAGERIHTESSRKYGLEDVDALLGGAGLERWRTWTDAGGRFAVHVAGRPGAARS